MNWGSLSDFFAMGGYALYVWGSYVITLGLIAVEISLLILRRRNILEHLEWTVRRFASRPRKASR